MSEIRPRNFSIFGGDDSPTSEHSGNENSAAVSYHASSGAQIGDLVKDEADVIGKYESKPPSESSHRPEDVTSEDGSAKSDELSSYEEFEDPDNQGPQNDHQRRLQAQKYTRLMGDLAAIKSANLTRQIFAHFEDYGRRRFISRKNWKGMRNIERGKSLRTYTAWPLHSQVVPRACHNVWADSITFPEDWRPSSDLEDVIFGLMLKRARQQWNQKVEESEKLALERPQSESSEIESSSSEDELEEAPPREPPQPTVAVQAVQRPIPAPAPIWAQPAPKVPVGQWVAPAPKPILPTQINLNFRRPVAHIAKASIEADARRLAFLQSQGVPTAKVVNLPLQRLAKQSAERFRFDSEAPLAQVSTQRHQMPAAPPTERARPASEALQAAARKTTSARTQTESGNVTEPQIRPTVTRKPPKKSPAKGPRLHTPIHGDLETTSSGYRNLKRKATDPDDPVFSADDERSFKLLKPSIRSVVSTVDDILVALHRSNNTPREIERGEDKQLLETASISANPTSPALGNLPNNPKHSNKARPRDWSNILGIAALIGVPVDVISQTAARCSAAFGESMEFTRLKEQDSTTAGQVYTFRPSSVPQSGMTEEPRFKWKIGDPCPFLDCKWFGSGSDGKTKEELAIHIRNKHSWFRKTGGPDLEARVHRKLGGVHRDGFLEHIPPLRNSVKQKRKKREKKQNRDTEMDLDE